MLAVIISIITISLAGVVFPYVLASLPLKLTLTQICDCAEVKYTAAIIQRVAITSLDSI